MMQFLAGNDRVCVLLFCGHDVEDAALATNPGTTAASSCECLNNQLLLLQQEGA